MSPRQRPSFPVDPLPWPTKGAGAACPEIGVEPKTLIKAWFEPMLPEIEAVEDTLDTTAANPQRLQEYESTFWQLWRKLVA